MGYGIFPLLEANLLVSIGTTYSTINKVKQISSECQWNLVKIITLEKEVELAEMFSKV